MGRLEDDFTAGIEHPELLHFRCGRGEGVAVDNDVSFLNGLVKVVRIERKAHLQGIEGVETGVIETITRIVEVANSLHIIFGVLEVREDKVYGFLQRGARGACFLVYGGDDGQTEFVGSRFGFVVLAVAHDHVGVGKGACEVGHALVVLQA